MFGAHVALLLRARLNPSLLSVVRRLLSRETDCLHAAVFDSRGLLVLHGTDMSRQRFMRVHRLAPRDFRKLSRAPGLRRAAEAVVPSLAMRSNCILLNVLGVRALIKHDMLVVFDTHHSNHSPRLNDTRDHSNLLTDITLRLSSDDGLPYEFRALEAILAHVAKSLNTEMKVHTTVLRNVLSHLDQSIDTAQLRYLLVQHKKMSQFHQRVLLIRDWLNDTLESDDDLNALYLTSKAQGIPREGADHAEVELLLESYYTTCDEMVQTVENLRSHIRTTEEIINIILDSNRNELMLLGIRLSSGLLALGIAMWVACVYGMNLENFIEETDGGFELVVAVGCVLLLVLLMVSTRQLRRLQRVTMTGVHRKV